MWQLTLLTALIMTSFCLAENESQNIGDRGCGWYGPHATKHGEIDLDNDLTQAGELPWMVMIMAKGVYWSFEYIYLSDGVLIHGQAVLVSIYSIENMKPENLVVRGGEWDISLNNQMNAAQQRDVSRIIIREPQAGEYQHLIAILILSSPFDIAINVRAVCIPDAEDEYDGSRCLVSGWGRTISNNDRTKLKRARIPIIWEDQCRDNYANYTCSHHDHKVQLFPNSICAGSEQYPSMCERDHGSPLICPLVENGSRYVLVGFDISGFQCLLDDPNLPSQFANVKAARRWISDEMLNNELDPQAYSSCSN